jgi:prepilin-type N-terminal cleavage/methylation domain-containing protein
MLRDRRGFTLVEVLTSLLILGVVTAVTIPVFLEWREEQHLAVQRFEAMLLLQERMERLQREGVPLKTRGSEERRGETVEGTVYRVSWKRAVRNHLVRTDVMVEWEDTKGNGRQLRLGGLQYIPYRENRDSPM